MDALPQFIRLAVVVLRFYLAVISAGDFQVSYEAGLTLGKPLNWLSENYFRTFLAIRLRDADIDLAYPHSSLAQKMFLNWSKNVHSAYS